jgi:hypothetical protein
MKPLSVFAVLLVLLCGCGKKDNDPAPVDYAGKVAAHTKWAGIMYKSLQSTLGGGSHGNSAYYLTVADTNMSVVKLTNDLVNVPFSAVPLRYRGFDANLKVASFDSSSGGTSASLFYYYAIDSVYYSASSIVPSEYGMDDPYEVAAGFHSL